MTKAEKPTYRELKQRLAETENIFDAIRRGDVDVIMGEREPLVLRSMELERKLRESESALVAAQAVAKIGSWQYDVALDKPTWSQEMFRIFDRDSARGEPAWRDHREHIHPQDWDRLDQTIRNAIDQGRHYRQAYRIIRRDGSIIWAETVGKAQQNEAGEVAGLSGTVQDITERKLAEQALIESEKNYRQLYSSIRDSILVADSNRKIIDCNAAFSTMFGYTLAEIKGRETSAMYARQDEFSNMGKAIKAHEEDRSFLTVINYQKKSGDIFPGETSVHYLHDDDDKVIGFIGIIRDISQKIAREQALGESEKKFRTAFESAPEGMALVDIKRRFLAVNQRICEMLGYSNDELVGKSYNQFTHPDDRQSGRDRWRQIVENRSDANRAEKRFINKDGTIVWCLASNSAIRDDQGEVTYILSHIYDITERIKSQNDLIRERNLSRKYLDTAGVILLALDQQGRVEMINHKGRQILGCRIGDSLGQDWFSRFIPEAFRQEAHKRHDEIIAGLVASHSHVESPVLTKSGETRLIRWFHTVLKDPEGNITGALSSGEDVTDYKAAQEAISWLAALVESSQDAIIGKDLNGFITSWNNAAGYIYGYGAEETIGRHITLLAPEDRGDEVEQILSAINKGESVSIYETTRRRKDGSLIDMSLSVSPVKDAEGRIVGAVTIAHPITEIKRARKEREKLETQLRQAQKMEAVGTLAGGIAHDFNNILTAIMGYSELALYELGPDSGATEYIKTVLDSANRAKDLTFQILSFSRQKEHRRIAVDMEPILKEILKMLRATLPTTIELKQNISVGTGQVMADPVHIQQILMNLCTNAAQAMEDSGGVLSVDLGVVDVEDSAVDGYVNLKPGKYQRLGVSDTGVGMDREVLERIFDPFFTTKDIGKGTGMGLSMVHGIVSDYDGAITVYSEPGQGSTFHVYIPLANGEVEREKPALPKDLQPGSERIIFVDDEPALVDIGIKTLSRLGYKVTGFISAREALEAIKAAPEDFDLLITDYTMPKMTGVQLAREASDVRPGMPIIMCTGFSERLNTASTQELKVSRLVMKPLMPKELSRIVREVLDKKQSLGNAR